MMTTTASELVVLRGGVVVPVAAMVLLLDLERRGFDVRVDSCDRAVICRSGKLLTCDDKRALSGYSECLKRLIRYCEGLQ